MADINMKDFVDALTADTSPESTDLVYVRTSAGNRKMTVQNLLNGIGSLAIKTGNGGDIGGYLVNEADQYIIISDSANLDFGLDDFSIELFVRLADYTPSAEKILIEKHASNLGYKLLLTTTGKLKLQFGNGSDFTTFSYESAAIGVTDNISTHFFVTIDRSANALFYINGRLNATVDISDSVAQTIDNTGSLYFFGNGTASVYGRIYLFRNYRRILSATEIQNSYNNGRPDLFEIDRSNKNGDVSNYYTSDFSSGVDGWAGVSATVSAVDTDADAAGVPPTDDWLKVAVTVSNTGTRRVVDNVYYLNNKYIRLFFTYFVPNDSLITAIVLSGYSGADPVIQTITVVKGSIQTVYIPDHLFIGANIPKLYFTGTGNAYIKGYYVGTNGCVTELVPRNAGSLGWIESSGNQLSGSTVNAPICLTKEARPPHYRDIRKAIAANTNTTLTGIVPKGYKIVSIRAKGSDSLADIKIGSASAGEQIVAATTTSGTAPKLLTLAATANDAYSESADVTLYARHDTSASGKTMDLIFHFEKVGN